MSQEFIIHSGIDTIGGNILEINTDRVRFFMDFGLSGGQAVDDQPDFSDLEREINQQSLPRLHHVFEVDQLEHSPAIEPFQADRDKPLVNSHFPPPYRPYGGLEISSAFCPNLPVPGLLLPASNFSRKGRGRRHFSPSYPT